MKTRIALAAPAVLAALALGACAKPDESIKAGEGSPPTSTESVESDAAALPPWPAPTDEVPARVDAAGLDLGPMGTAEHYHPQLEISIEGKPVQVPANIGIDPSTGAMSALHTHETDGTIHIEADTVGEVFTHGQLFTEWGVELTSTRIGGVTSKADEKVSLISNGTRVNGDPGDLRLEPDQKIVLRLP